MRLNKLSLGDKKKFDRYLKLGEHELSVYAFANIYIWRKLFDIRWAVIEDRLCVFFKDNIGSFLYLPPLGKSNSAETVSEAFKVLDKLNKNPEFAHIENAEEKDLRFYQKLSFDCSFKAYDYISKRTDLAEFSGNRFKSKRASFNYFTKHYNFEYEKLSLRHKKDCFKLYDLWAKQRKSGNSDNVYQWMLDDSRSSLQEALTNYSALGFQGLVVRVNNVIKGFTLGFELNKNTFCVLYEITDLSIKGLAQFIFCVFARELKDYKYINIMDDSGLDNLKKVKLSYRPEKLAPAYIVKRKI